MSRPFARAFPRVPVREYSSFRSFKEFKAHVAGAEVVMALDSSSSDSHEVVYGALQLHEVVATGAAKRMTVVAVRLDFRTDAVEHLLAAIKIAKGHYEWQGEIHKDPVRFS